MFLLPNSYSCITKPIKESESKYFFVTKVVDGDTFWVDDGSEKGLKIRFIGVDAPESRRTGRKEIGYYGQEAKEYMTKLLSGKRVRLEYDVGMFDQYKRTLAYVYLEDNTFVVYSGQTDPPFRIIDPPDEVNHPEGQS